MVAFPICPICNPTEFPRDPLELGVARLAPTFYRRRKNPLRHKGRLPQQLAGLQHDEGASQSLVLIAGGGTGRSEGEPSFDSAGGGGGSVGSAAGGSLAGVG